MKRLIIIFPIIALAIACLLQGCKKEDKYPSRVVTISYPTVTLLGDTAITLTRGATWNDPGATWNDAVTGESGKITVSVNTSVDSVYWLLYTATNKNGFQTTVHRGLAVTNMGGGLNISGIYSDSYGSTDTVRLTSGMALFYHTNVDCQGNPGYMVIKSDSTIAVATLYNADLTGAVIPESFHGDTIMYTRPITFWYTPSVLNVPPGSQSSFGLPIGITITFEHQIL